MSDRRRGSFQLESDEVHRLKDIFQSSLKTLVDDEGEMEDLLNFTVVMIQNGKSVDEMEKELDDIYGQEYSKRIGALLQSYLDSHPMNSEGNIVSKESNGKVNGAESAQNPPHLVSLKSSRGNNALTMSGALGSSREKVKNSELKSTTSTPTQNNHHRNDKKDQPTNRNSNNDRAKDAFERLTNPDTRNRLLAASNGRGTPDGGGRGRGNNRGGGDYRGGGGGGGRTGGRNSLAARDETKKHSQQDFPQNSRGFGRHHGGRDVGRGRFGGNRGGRGGEHVTTREISEGAGRVDQGCRGRHGGGGRGNFVEHNPPMKRQRIGEGNEDQEDVSYAKNQNWDENNLDHSHQEDYNDYNQGYYYEDTNYGYPGYRGGGYFGRGGRFGRGRGRFHNTWERNPGRGDAGTITTSNNNVETSNMDAEGEGQTALDSTTITAADAAAVHPSPMVAAAFAGRGRGGAARGYYRGGRGGRVNAYHAHVADILASKQWVRKKESNGAAEGGDENDGGGSNNHVGGDNADNMG